MAGPKTMDHLPVFEQLGETQVILQFSHLENDVGRESRAWLHGITEAREKSRHAELLAEIKNPHWSMAPGFIVGFVAMVASVFAAYYSYLAYSQPQQPSAVNQQSQNAPSTLQKPLPLSQSQLQQSNKR